MLDIPSFVCAHSSAPLLAHCMPRCPAHLQQAQAVLEGLDAQLGQQGGLGGADLVARLDQVHVGHNLNGTLVDLGGNAQGLVTQTGGKAVLVMP